MDSIKDTKKLKKHFINHKRKNLDHNQIIQPELEEDWECYNCGCTFKAKLDIKGYSVYNQNYDFSEDYVISNDEDKEKLF